MVLASEGAVSDSTIVFDFVRIEAVTAKAVLLHRDDWGEDHWVPLSVINLDDSIIELEKGSEDNSIAIAEWFCEKAGLE